MAEFFLKACTLNGQIAWNPDTTGIIAPMHTPSDALDCMSKTRAGTYLDIHSWVFTPESYRDLFQDLKTLKFISMAEHAFTDTVGHGFFVQLVKH